MNIAVIGAGWYGCHVAYMLKKAGYDVTLFEKNGDIFTETSGTFGIRLHAGPHYPRSRITRESCYKHFYHFAEIYPELTIEHEYSIYGLGYTDVDGNSSKVNKQQFDEVCQECDRYEKIDPNAWGYKNLQSAFNIYEPSIAVGDKLRETFKKYLNDLKVKIIFNYKVESLENFKNKVLINNKYAFDYIVNATYYHDPLTSETKLPFGIEVIYQPCLALTYVDNKPTIKPFSFIVMDGWYPCIMPVNDATTESIFNRKYVLTHGKYTIMSSSKSHEDAHGVLEKINDNFIMDHVKPLCEKDIMRFWPEFQDRFEFTGWTGTVAAKLRTEKEFRAALTWERDKVIYIFSGKINNVFDAYDEVLAIINNRQILEHDNYKYVKGGELDFAFSEVTEKPNGILPNTSELQTYSEIITSITEV